MDQQKLLSLPDLVTEEGVVIHILNIGGWLRVLIEVGDDVKSDDLRNAIPPALQWRDYLREFYRDIDGGLLAHVLTTEDGRIIAQTIGPRLIQELFIRRFLDEKQQGKTYAAIAKEINHYVSEFLRKTDIHTARVLLETVGIGDDEINEALQYGLERIAAGEAPFQDDYPVDRDRIRNAMRRWRGDWKDRSKRKAK